MKFLDTKLAAFFARYNFDIEGPSIDSASAALLYDLKLGLEKSESPFTQEMLPTWIKAKKPNNKRVIVLDAGGTNFRSYLIEIKDNAVKILQSKKGSLPATETSLTKDEFFEAIADRIEYLRDLAENINFCFAYSVQMTGEKDAIVLRMSKQIQVSGILGSKVGASLFEVLKKRGWKNLKKVSVINDTVAALLSGLLLKKHFSSYIGIILGTGFNIAYIESNHIKKLTKEQQLKDQIIVCETAKTNRVVASDFDIELQDTTIDKNTCKLEKMCSGAYIGDLISICFKRACLEKIFTENINANLYKYNFSFKTINEFLSDENTTQNEITILLQNLSADIGDVNLLKGIAQAVINRAARIVAATLIATALKSEKGKTADAPICIVAEGTTFKKAFGLKSKVQEILNETLTKKHGIFFELHEVENAVAFGTAFFE